MKKFLAVLLAVLMVASLLAACGGGDGGSSTKTDTGNNGGTGTDTNDDPLYGEDNVKLLVWAADNAQALTKQLCDEFIAQYPGKKITIEVKAQGESDVGSMIANDPKKAADVFSFACDQINDLVKRNLLLPVFNDYLDEVKENNSAFSVSAATLNDKVQAFPQTGENGYYLVYDKRYVTDEDAQTLEGVLAACKKAGKKFIMDAGNGFFASIFPFTGGLTLAGLEDDGTQIFDYDEEQVVDALEAFSKLFHQYSDIFESADCSDISSGLMVSPTTVAAGIDGSWNSANVASALGENFGAAKLPTININGTDTQIVSLNGCKLMGVNSNTQFPETAQLLARYLTNESSQLKRLQALSWAPSNKKVVESEELQSNKALVALLDQANYALPQTNIAANYWSPIGALGKKLYQGDSSRSAVQSEFKKAVNNILNG